MGEICKICNGTKMILNKENIPIPCECLKKARLESIYKQIGIPIRFMGSNLEDYLLKQDAHGKDIDPISESKKTVARSVVKKFIDSLPNMIDGEPFSFEIEGKGEVKSFTLLMMGQEHSCKSMLSACIAKEAIKKNILSFYLEWAEIINLCYDYYSDASSRNKTKIEKYEKIISIVESDKLLIIDNFSSVYENNNKFEEDKITSNVRRQIDAMFSERSKKAAPTVIATNQSLKELISDNKYGPVFLSIIEDSIKIDLPTLGKSFNNFDIKKVN